MSGQEQYLADQQLVALPPSPALSRMSRRDRQERAEAICAVRQEVGRPGGWTQNTMEGFWGSHCVLGAGDYLVEERGFDQDQMERGLGWLQDHLPGRAGVVAFNDAWFRTQGQVVAALADCERELDPGHAGCLESGRERDALAAIDSPTPAWVRRLQSQPLVMNAGEPNQGDSPPCSRPQLAWGREWVEDDDWEPVGQYRPHGIWNGQQPATPGFQEGRLAPRSRPESVVAQLREQPQLLLLGGGVLIGSWLLAPLLLVLTAVGLVVGGVAWKVAPLVVERRRERARVEAERAAQEWGSMGWDDDEDDDGGDDPGDPAIQVEGPNTDPAGWSVEEPRHPEPVVVPTTEPMWDDPAPEEPAWLPVEEPARERPAPLAVESERVAPELPQHAGLARQSNGDLAAALPPAGQGSWMDRRIRQDWLWRPDAVEVDR